MWQERLKNELERAADQAGIDLDVQIADHITPRIAGLRSELRRLEIHESERHHPKGSTSPTQAANQDTPTVGLRPIYSAPLSTFEATVGKLMVQTRSASPTKYLPQTEIAKIAALLDRENLPVRRNLKHKAARTMADYNQRHPTAAIKSWKTALSHPQFRRAVRKRFSRAEEKYKKATPHVLTVSAGSPRTAI
jgi:hypothetical protein